MFRRCSVPAKRRTIIADSGLLAFDARGGDLILRLFEGSTTELGDADPERLQRNFFREDVIRVRGVATRLDRNEDTSQSVIVPSTLLVCHCRAHLRHPIADLVC